MVLPVTTLTLVYLAEYALVMRSSLVDEMDEDYLTTARAKGLMDKLVRRRHAVPNALLPTITLIFLNLGFTVSGAITVETVFSWPGLGLLSYEALRGPGRGTAAGHLPAVLHRRRAGEPRGRPALRRDRPESEVMMASDGQTPAARRWRNRRRGDGRSRGPADARPRCAAGGSSARTGRAWRAWGCCSSSPSWRSWRRYCSRRTTISVTRATGELMAPPSGQYWLGTDDSGRSMLALLAWGARVSLTVGIAATLISMLIGTSVGIASGHYRGLGGAL